MEVAIRNRQRGRRIDVRRLRELTEALVRDELALTEVALGIHLIGARRMAVLNRHWLGHEGSTDILTFDHSEAGGGDAGRGAGRVAARARTRRRGPRPLHGECFISVDDAVRQAREFGTSPALEVVRYVVHGVLHLLGYDDLEAGARRVMKQAENRLVRRLAARGSLGRLVGVGRRG